ENVKEPPSISASTSVRPATMLSRSSCVRMPVSASIVAWAIDPAISWRNRRWSNPIEALISSMMASGPVANRPPHILLLIEYLGDCFMTDMHAHRPGSTSRVRLWVILGVTGLALAIAAWLWLGNAGEAKECPVQEAAALAIDAAAKGELAALNGTGEGRGY